MARAKRPDPPQPTEEQMRAAGCLDKYGFQSEAHSEHMRINGDCSWCGSYDKSKWLSR
jgi:hypothetical protein